MGWLLELYRRALRPIGYLAHGGPQKAGQIKKLLMTELRKGIVSGDELKTFEKDLKEKKWEHYLIDDVELEKFYSKGMHRELLNEIKKMKMKKSKSKSKKKSRRS